jgi:AP-3 complex subunit sigma
MLQVYIYIRPIDKFLFTSFSVRQAAKARKESFASANPLSLGGGGPRGGNLKTPISWLTGKLTGVGVR